MHLTKGDTRRPAPTNSAALNRIAGGAAVTFAGKLLGAFLRYITQAVIALFLGAQAFGIYALGIALYQFGELFAALGLPSGVVRFASVYVGSGQRGKLAGLLRQAMRLPFGGGVVVGAVIFASAELVAAGVFKEPRVAPVLRVVALALPFGAAMMVGALATTASGTARFLVYVRDIVHPVANLILVAILCALGFGVVGAAGAWLAAAVLGLTTTVVLVRATFPVVRDRSVKPSYETGALLHFSLPLALGEFSWLLLLWTDVLMLGYFGSSTEVGVYRAVSQTALFIPIFLGSLNTIFAPTIADLYHRGRVDRMASVFQTATRWSLMLTAPVYILLVIEPDSILSIFGPEFVLGATPLVILCTGQLVNAGSGGVGYMLMMSDHPYAKLTGDVLFAAVNVVLNVLLIPRYGLPGAAMATGISIAGLNVLRILQVRVLLGVHAYNVRFLKIAIAGVAGALGGLAASSGLSGAHFLVKIAVGGVVVGGSYLVALWLMGIEGDDRAVFNRMRDRLLGTGEAGERAN